MGLKVGIVTEYYYPLLGGISENVHNTAVRLRDRGHDVRIITSNLDGVQDGSAPPAPIIRIGRSASIYSNGSVARVTVGKHLISELKATFAREKFDLLHLHSPLVPTLPMFAQFAAPCPTVGTFHTYFDRSLWYSLLKSAVQKKLINRLSGQIAVSQSCIDALSPFFKINARIIPNGVNTSEFSPDVPGFPQFDDGKKNLLFLGRLDPRNGLSLMINAFGLIKSKFPEARLIIVGDGMLKEYYKRRLPEGLKSDIHLAGPALAERNRYYSSCDVFCSPVEKASFGVTLLEAMASGKPIVATDNRGYRELLGPKEGFIVPPGDPRAFARAVLKLLEDPDLRREKGMNGRARALAFSWDTVVDSIAGFYKEILNGP
ncbi:MAG: glycosyltransferase family 4 protein [Syntrophobacteraceae bacterium]